MTEEEIKTLVDAEFERRFPAGMISGFLIDGSNNPAGWLICDGREITQTSHPRLWHKLSHENLDASLRTDTGIKIPDLRGKFLRGLNLELEDTSELGDAGNARLSGSYQSDEFESHSHVQRHRPVKGHFSPSGWESVPHVTHNGHNGVKTAEDGGPETRPRNVALVWCISI